MLREYKINAILLGTFTVKDIQPGHYCPYCLHGFSSKSILYNHLPYCEIHRLQKIQLPDNEHKWLNYKDVAKQLKVPFS